MTRLCERPQYALGLALLFTAAVFAPMALDRADSFPLSTYPMFAKHRGQPRMVKLVAVTDDGQVAVPPDMLGTREVLQAKVLLDRVARGGARQRANFCRQTAARLATRSEAATWNQLRLTEVRFDPIRYFYNGAQPESEKVLTTCPVSRSEKRGAP
jgi:hypothetical protein